MIALMRKELRPGHESVACDVCGRTILKGERTEAYLAPGGRRHQVCELCFARAEHLGWIRESGAGDAPTRARAGRPEPRRPFFGRLRGREVRRSAPPPVNGNEAEMGVEPAAGVEEAAPTEASAPRMIER